MTQKEKELLFKDLSARLPYGVKAQYYGSAEEILTVDTIEAIYAQPSVEIIIGQYGLEIEDIKPYLRPMSSMTEEERDDFYHNRTFHDGHMWESEGADVDWLNANHFDYRGLIDKGLALSTDEFNPYKD